MTSKSHCAPVRPALMTGRCHCKSLEIALYIQPDSVSSCNCSICQRTAGLWTYPHPKDVSITSHQPLGRYVQGDRMICLHFCTTCGCHTHWTPLYTAQTPRLGINVRLFDPKIWEGLEIEHVNGRDF